MRKCSVIRASFWDSPIWETLKSLPAEHLRVYLHLVHGPNAALCGLYRVSVGAVAEDTDTDPDQVRGIIEDLAETGWAEWEPPIIWIRGAGNIADQTGSPNWKANPNWLAATKNYLSSLPDAPIVTRFCAHWDIEPPDPAARSTRGHGRERGSDLSTPYRYPIDTLSGVDRLKTAGGAQ